VVRNLEIEKIYIGLELWSLNVTFNNIPVISWWSVFADMMAETSSLTSGYSAADDLSLPIPLSPRLERVHIREVRVMVFKRHFQQYSSYIVVVSFIGGGNQSTRRKSSTCHKS
jgi:hypothetical protein